MFCLAGDLSCFTYDLSCSTGYFLTYLMNNLALIEICLSVLVGCQVFRSYFIASQEKRYALLEMFILVLEVFGGF